MHKRHSLITHQVDTSTLIKLNAYWTVSFPVTKKLSHTHFSHPLSRMVRLDAQISSLRPGVLRTYQVWGTRANIGKTVATAILLRSIWEKRRVRHSIAKEGMHFVKPVCSSTAADHQPKRDNRWMRWAFNRCMPNNRMNDLFSTATIYQLDVNVSVV